MKLAVIKGARVLMSTDGSNKLFVDTGCGCVEVCTTAALEKVYDLLYNVPVSVDWTLGGVLFVSGGPYYRAVTGNLEMTPLRAVSNPTVEHRWFYFYDGPDAQGNLEGFSDWLQGASLAKDHIPAAAHGVNIEYVRLECRKADGSVLTDTAEVSTEIKLRSSSIVQQAT